MRPHASDLLAAVGFLAGAGVMISESFSEDYRSTGVGVAHDAVFYPRIVLALIVVLALLLAVRAIRAGVSAQHATRDDAGTHPVSARWLPATGMIMAAVGYAVLLQGIGYIAATFVFVAVTPILLGFRQWAPMIITTLLFPLASWFLFAKVIGIPLPSGSWLGLV